MTQTFPSPNAAPARPSPPTVASCLPPTVWSDLDASAQQQLAHCLSDLIRRIRAVPSVATKENSHDAGAHSS
ncbi:MAG: hypothetical protein ACE5I7_19460 [Candidatus Binatia bacterium]